MAKIYCKGTQGKRRVNGSICELKVNSRQNQQRESRARTPAQVFNEGYTELGNCYTLNQGLFSPTFYGGKEFICTKCCYGVVYFICFTLIGCRPNLLGKGTLQNLQGH